PNRSNDACAFFVTATTSPSAAAKMTTEGDAGRGPCSSSSTTAGATNPWAWQTPAAPSIAHRTARADAGLATGPACAATVWSHNAPFVHTPPWHVSSRQVSPLSQAVPSVTGPTMHPPGPQVICSQTPATRVVVVVLVVGTVVALVDGAV